METERARKTGDLNARNGEVPLTDRNINGNESKDRKAGSVDSRLS